MNLIEQVKSQVEHGKFPFNLWFENEKMKVYLRFSFRFLEGKRYRCLDLASVEVEGKLRGTGIFTSFFNGILEFSPVVFVENVLSEKFRNFFRKLGWNEIFDGYSYSFYRIATNSAIKGIG